MRVEPDLRDIGPYEPGAPALRPEDRNLATAALVLLFGYMVLGRSFAQIGLPSLNVFLGELLLVAAIIMPRLRGGFTGAIQALVHGNPLHALTWSILLFLVYGTFQLGLAGLGGANLLEALKVFAFHYYVVLIFIGLRLGLLVPDLLERVCRAVPWGVGAFLILSVAHINFSLPLSAAVGLYAGIGAPVGMLMIISLERRFIRHLPAFIVCTFSWLYFQVRGDWIGVGAAVIVWGALTKRLRLVLTGLLACMFLFVFLDVAGIRISASENRGGAVGGREIFGRLVAPFDKELGEKLVPDADVFAGTAQWREDFWKDIREAVNSSEEKRLFGLGYGNPLSDLTSFINSDLRTPHNVFYFALGYGGWLGVLAFGGMHFFVLIALWKAFKVTGNPFGIMLWVFATLTGLFGNFFETPYNSAPYYALIGISLAPVVRRTGWPVLSTSIVDSRGPGESLSMSPRVHALTGHRSLDGNRRREPRTRADRALGRYGDPAPAAAEHRGGGDQSA